MPAAGKRAGDRSAIAGRLNDVIAHAPAGDRAVYLTYDDGPGRSTPAILDLLRNHDARATFFFVGAEAKRFPEVAHRVVAEGHAVGSHTMMHLDHYAVEPEEAVADMLAGADAIATVLGFTPRVYRAPYGHFVAATIAEAARRGWTCVHWSTLGFDWMEDATPESVAHHVLEHLDPGGIVLLHDSRRAKPMDPEPVVDGTAILLDELGRRGLQARSLTAIL